MTGLSDELTELTPVVKSNIADCACSETDCGAFSVHASGSLRLVAWWVYTRMHHVEESTVNRIAIRHSWGDMTIFTLLATGFTSPTSRECTVRGAHLRCRLNDDTHGYGVACISHGNTPSKNSVAQLWLEMKL